MVIKIYFAARPSANKKEPGPFFSSENGYETYTFYSSVNDYQIAAAQEFIDNHVEYLLISAAYPLGWDDVLMKAKAAGIGVFLFDRLIDCDPSLYEAAVTPDMAYEGELAVEWLLSLGLEEYKVVHLQGMLGTAAQVGRSAALEEQFAAGTMTKVVQQTANWDGNTAREIVSSAIDAGKDFNVIFAENDSMAYGAVSALDSAGITHGINGYVTVISFDCNKWALRELLAGNWNFDVQCSPFQAAIIDYFIKALKSGKQIEGLNELKQLTSFDVGFDARTITEEDIETFGLGD